jgi:peptide-methionine (S)-S-oxide reductase
MEAQMQQQEEKRTDMAQLETAILAGGCFWCTEATLQKLRGVQTITPGYAASKVENPSYEAVCSGRTGAAEAIEITFDPSIISYGKLLEIFWHVHDPTTLNRQGNDVGTQYRSGIYYLNEEQKQTALASKKALEQSGSYKNPVVTEIVPFTNFYQAEDYHKDYYERNRFQPYCMFVIDPKVRKILKEYQKEIEV